MLREFSVDIIHPTTEQDTIYSLLAKRAARDPHGVIAEFREPTGGQWVSINARDMLERVHQVAKGLTQLGVRPGDMVLIYAPTSYDWGVVDFACAAIGAVSVPLDETDSVARISQICRDVAPVVAFASDGVHAHALVTAFAAQHCSSYLFTFQSGGINEVMHCGRLLSDEALSRIISRVRADDLATIVYAPESKGKPNGVMLSHRNFTHIVFASYDALPNVLYAPSRLLLFEPLAHCFARYIQYVAIGAHGVVGYQPGAEHLLVDMREFQPTYILGTPQVLARVYNAASQKAGSGFRGLIYTHATRHFIRWSKDGVPGGYHSPESRLLHVFFMLTVGFSIRSALGSNLRYLACGAVPFSTDLAHFFNGIDGITFIQGYGMSETAALCLVNYEWANKVGTVGKPVPGIAVKLAKNHELLIKGPNVFRGYYRQPVLTAQVVGSDGWLHTGELATIDGTGCVTIIKRNRHVITTGKRSHKTRTVGTVKHHENEGLNEAADR